MVAGDGLVVVTREGDLRFWAIDDRIERTLVVADGRAVSSPVVDPAGTSVAYVLDQAEVRVLDLESRVDRRVDAGDFAFVFDPVWWNSSIVWQAWSAPHMPWDESCLVSDNGIVHRSPDVQHQQPQSTLDGRVLGWLDDSSGWLNVVVDGRVRVDEPAEHGGPTWGERQRSWCFDSTGTRAAFVRNENGFGRLCTYDLETGTVVERAKAVHGQLSWRGDVLAAIRTGGRTPTQIVVYDTRDDEWRRSTIDIGPTHDWHKCAALVEPELVQVTTEAGGDLYARLYRSPHEPESTGIGSASRRLLCWVHGGPTDQWQVTFMPRFAFWLDRGFDVLVPDHRGSTGHGRMYTQALRGEWGEIDVTDVRAVLEGVQSRFGYDAASTAIVGSSAGGSTALNVGARHGHLIAAVVVAYPVTDIAGLDATTHRFEAHYNRSLVGSPEDTRRLSAQRSPLAQVGALSRTSVLVFHGSDDHVVPIEQSLTLVEELRQHGADVELTIFEGEGHGFRKLENRIEEFEHMERFLEQRLGHGRAG